MTHRERLGKAIDNMEKTKHCLEIFDKVLEEVAYSKIKTLCDEFAMAVLTGMLAADKSYDVPIETLAIFAYEQADAMLKAREGM